MLRHPCFSSGAAHKFGRIHLPVAPTCNIQCAYCRRDHDCVHENRPGVCHGVVTPQDALVRLEQALSEMPYITVAGIAGPGDAFSEPDLTLETFELIRRAHPDMALCVSTNGLMIKASIDALQALDVRFVTITINTVDPNLGTRLYQSIHYGGETLRGLHGAQRLIERQLEAVAILKEKQFTVKVNCVVVPGVNEDHTIFLARQMGRLGVDLMNLLPLIPLPKTPMQHLAPPTPAKMRTLREEAGRYVPQMTHCRRCRADAIGKLHETSNSPMAITLNPLP
jgi:nitrogen fixation protein NifB